jgi:hypothetical protein
MSSVVISGDTSGAITLAAPSVAGTNTITLPASTGTVLTTGSPQSGGVLQVVNVSYSNNSSTSSTSLIATGLSASITPKFATSKILIIANMNGVGENSGNNGNHFEIFKNGSSLVYWDDIAGYGAANANYSTAITYLDSPATTSSTAYGIYYKRVGGGNGVVYFNNYVTTNNQTVSSITLMEIAA